MLNIMLSENEILEKIQEHIRSCLLDSYLSNQQMEKFENKSIRFASSYYFGVPHEENHLFKYHFVQFYDDNGFWSDSAFLELKSLLSKTKNSLFVVSDDRLDDYSDKKEYIVLKNISLLSSKNVVLFCEKM